MAGPAARQVTRYDSVASKPGQDVCGPATGDTPALVYVVFGFLRDWSWFMLGTTIETEKNRPPPSRPDSMPLGKRRHVIGVLELEGRRMIRSAVTVGFSKPLP